VAHSLFWKVEENGEESDPWWLEEFNWTAEFGGETLTLRNDELEPFAENFDRNRTRIQKPRFREDTHGTERRSLYTIHGELIKVRSELQNHIDAKSEASFPDFPKTLFDVEQGRVVVSDEFDKWIDSFLKLLPALGSEATALYLANTGTSRSSAETAIDSKLFEKLDQIGVIQDSGYNTSYVRPYNSILEATEVANRRVPNGEDNSNLAGLEYQLYRSFIESFNPPDKQTAELFNNATQNTPPKLNKGKLGAFTRVACGSPLLLSNSSRPQLMTVSMYSVNTHGSSGYMKGSDKYRSIRRLLERSGWFEYV
jgi:hypothetical protein